MACFLRWGHDWQDPSDSVKQKITDQLSLLGIHAEQIEVCSKCQRVKMLASTFLNPKPRTVIMPPYPEEET